MREWSQPKLVVLGRATPEESVLEVCKNHEVASQYAQRLPELQQAVACRGRTAGASPAAERTAVAHVSDGT